MKTKNTLKVPQGMLKAFISKIDSQPGLILDSDFHMVYPKFPKKYSMHNDTSSMYNDYSGYTSSMPNDYSGYTSSMPNDYTSVIGTGGNIQKTLDERVKLELAVNTISDNTKREVLSNEENVSLLIKKLKNEDLIQFISLLGNSEEANKIKEILFLDFSNLKSLILRPGLFAECINVLNSSNEFDRKIKKTLFLDAKYENLIMESMYIDNIRFFLKNLNSEDELDAQIKEKYFLDDNRVSQIINRIPTFYIREIHSILSKENQLDKKIKRKLFIEKKLYEGYKMHHDNMYLSHRDNQYEYSKSDTYRSFYSLFSFIHLLDSSDEIDNEIKKNIFFDDKTFEFLIASTNVNHLSPIIRRIVESSTETDTEIKNNIPSLIGKMNLKNIKKFISLLSSSTEGIKIKEKLFLDPSNLSGLCKTIFALDFNSEADMEIKRRLFLDSKYSGIIIDNMSPDLFVSLLKVLNTDNELDTQIKEKYFLDDNLISLVIQRIQDPSIIYSINEVLSTNREVDAEIKRKMFFDYENLEKMIIKLDKRNFKSIIKDIFTSSNGVNAEIKREIILDRKKYGLIIEKIIQEYDSSELKNFFNSIINPSTKDNHDYNNAEMKESIFLDQENFDLLLKNIELRNRNDCQSNIFDLSTLILMLSNENQTDVEIIKNFLSKKNLYKVINNSSSKGIVEVIRQLESMKITDGSGNALSTMMIEDNSVQKRIQSLENMQNSSNNLSNLLSYLENESSLTSKIDCQILDVILKSDRISSDILSYTTRIKYRIYRILRFFLNTSLEKANIINDDGYLTDRIQSTIEDMYSQEQEQLTRSSLGSPKSDLWKKLYKFLRGTYVVNQKGDYVCAVLDSNTAYMNKEGQQIEIHNLKFNDNDGKLHHEGAFYSSLIALETSEEKLNPNGTVEYYAKEGAKHDCLSILIEGEMVHLYCPTKNSPEQNNFLQNIMAEIYEIENNRELNPRGLKFSFGIAYSDGNSASSMGIRPIFVEDVYSLLINHGVIEKQDISLSEIDNEVHRRK